ncbi:MAG: hypothetical protein IJ272_08145 [Clostridia bacterium]|nr:hypothetical protein [Clostridia bacterium]
MSIAVAQQKIWHKAYEKALETITSLRNHCDFKYTKDSVNAKEVEILNAVRPTVKRYVPGTPIEKEYVDASNKTLKIDQFFYFNISLDDIYKAQSVPGALEASADEGSRALAEEGDKYVASLVKAGVEAGTITAVDCGTPTKTNAVDKVEDGFAVLYENNCKVSESYWLEIAPSFHKVLRPSLTELLTNNVEMAKKGIVGRYGNANVTIENLLAKDDTSVYNQLRTEHAVAFVEQINKVEAYRPQDGFEDALKGLYAFGGLVTRPEEIVVLKTAI